jgi:hypothetical protein
MKKNTSQRMFIFVMIMTVIVVLMTTRRESYNPWLPWNWFRKPEPPRPRPMPERPRPYPMPERPRPYPMPERPRPMPERPRPMPGRPYLMPKPPRPGCHPFSKDLRCQGTDARDLVFLNRPAQPISPEVEARMQTKIKYR